VKNYAWLLLIFFTFFSSVSCTKRIIKAKPVTVYGNAAEDEPAVLEDVFLENQYLSLRFMPETTAIILTDKSTGVQWHSNPKGAAVDSFADVVTTYLMDSQFSLVYSDATGTEMTLYSGESSVKLKAYEYEVVNGVLEVRYTVGDVARTFRIPPALTEDRMNAFMEKMEDSQLGMLESSYRLYDINNLRTNDDRDALLAAYPDLSRTNLHVLRDTTQPYMKEILEGYFRDAGYTYEEYFDDASRYPSASGMDKPAFSLVIRYILDGKSLVLNVPFEQIGYRPNFPFRQLALLPFMGSGNVNDQGFMLVPDGSGAIINFNNGKQSQVPYNVRIYGWDEAMPRDAIVSDSRAPFPVFGIQKNGSALLCIIEEGAPYASIRADVSGRNASWNRVYAFFDIVHGARLDITGRNERNVYLYENGLPDGESITMRYTPCASPGYVGMAKEYRSWLLKNYPEMEKTRESGVPVAVEIVGAVNKTQHRLGIPFDLPLSLTSYKETESIINDLAGFGWKNVRIKLNGWFNHSVEHSVPTKLKLIDELGSTRDFKNMVSAVDKNNFELYPEVDFFYVKDVKAFSGFSLYRDAARYVSRERIQSYPFSFVWFGERTQWGKLSYIARPASMMSMMDNFVPRAAKFGVRNFTFRNMGTKLAGDYHEKRLVSREASMRMRQKKLDDLRRAGNGVIVNTGFSYAVPWVDMVTDMMLDDQYFGISDSAVPFYQIALHGLVPYTGRAINLAEDYTKNLLKTIESGAGLYFSFMKEETSELQETKFRQFYANEYDKWIGDADALYKQFSADFGHLYSLDITDHRILSAGVTVTEYENGTRVVVNTSNKHWTYNGVNISADSYVVLGRGE
jgi:hypothetical protein